PVTSREHASCSARSPMRTRTSPTSAAGCDRSADAGTLVDGPSSASLSHPLRTVTAELPPHAPPINEVTDEHRRAARHAGAHTRDPVYREWRRDIVCGHHWTGRGTGNRRAGRVVRTPEGRLRARGRRRGHRRGAGEASLLPQRRIDAEPHRSDR